MLSVWINVSMENLGKEFVKSINREIEMIIKWIIDEMD